MRRSVSSALGFVALACTGGAAIVACSSEPATTFEVSAPEYSSVAELSAAADVVVTGVVADVLGRELDEGDGSGRGVPVVFYSLEVQDVLKGKAAATLVLNWLDTSEIQAEYQTPLKAGSRVLLYLDEVSHDDAPGIDKYDTTYVALSGDIGTFDIDGGTARARTAVVQSLDGESQVRAEDERLAFTIAEAAKVVNTSATR